MYSRNWIVLANESGYSARLANALAKKLQARGDQVTQACPGDAAQIESLLRHAQSSIDKVDGIVHLAGLGATAEDAEPSAMLAAQVERCASVAALVQACASTMTATACWIVTSGAASDLLPARRGKPARGGASIVDAALWGFGRTLMNEASGCTVRLVDLEDPAALKPVVAALDRELEQPDEELEVVITATGERYAPRLRLEPRPAPAAAPVADADAPTLRLAFQFPGQLRNLRWEAHPRRRAAPRRGRDRRARRPA